MAAMRPLIAAEPMLRAPSPEMVSESTVTGLFDCATTGADSYRAFRYQWIGTPVGRPAIAFHRGRVYVSWNGATKVARWQILSGRDAHALSVVRSVPKTGFETSAPIPRGPLVAVRALDARGRSLGLSRPLRRG